MCKTFDVIELVSSSNWTLIIYYLVLFPGFFFFYRHLSWCLACVNKTSLHRFFFSPQLKSMSQRMSCGSGKLCVGLRGKILVEKDIYSINKKPALLRATHCKNLRHLCYFWGDCERGFTREHLPLNSGRHFSTGNPFGEDEEGLQPQLWTRYQPFHTLFLSHHLCSGTWIFFHEYPRLETPGCHVIIS